MVMVVGIGTDLGAVVILGNHFNYRGIGGIQMSKHYPELHKIIMSALDNGDYEVVTKFDNSGNFDGKHSTKMKLPISKKYIEISHRQYAYNGEDVYENDVSLVASFVERAWYGMKTYSYIDIDKLFTANEMAMVNEKLRKSFNEHKAMKFREKMDVRIAEDAIYAEKIRKSINEERYQSR